MAYNQEYIKKILQEVVYPALYKNIVDLNSVRQRRILQLRLRLPDRER
jgi:hypothetical protein